MMSVGFELTISAGERPKTYVLDRVVSGTGGNRHFDSLKCQGFLDQLRKINFSRGAAPMEVAKSSPATVAKSYTID